MAWTVREASLAASGHSASGGKWAAVRHEVWRRPSKESGGSALSRSAPPSPTAMSVSANWRWRSCEARPKAQSNPPGAGSQEAGSAMCAGRWDLARPLALDLMGRSAQ